MGFEILDGSRFVDSGLLLPCDPVDFIRPQFRLVYLLTISNGLGDPFTNTLTSRLL